jgi:hypothetical protein
MRALWIILLIIMNGRNRDGYNGIGKVKPDSRQGLQTKPAYQGAMMGYTWGEYFCFDLSLK